MSRSTWKCYGCGNHIGVAIRHCPTCNPHLSAGAATPAPEPTDAEPGFWTITMEGGDNGGRYRIEGRYGTNREAAHAAYEAIVRGALLRAATPAPEPTALHAAFVAGALWRNTQTTTGYVEPMIARDWVEAEAARRFPAATPTAEPTHVGNPKSCPVCLALATEDGPKFHPDSDVGPWDFACQGCGHITFPVPSGPSAGECPICLRGAAPRPPSAPSAPTGEPIDAPRCEWWKPGPSGQCNRAASVLVTMRPHEPGCEDEEWKLCRQHADCCVSGSCNPNYAWAAERPLRGSRPPEPAQPFGISETLRPPEPARTDTAKALTEGAQDREAEAVCALNERIAEWKAGECDGPTVGHAIKALLAAARSVGYAEGRTAVRGAAAPAPTTEGTDA